MTVRLSLPTIPARQTRVVKDQEDQAVFRRLTKNSVENAAANMEGSDWNESEVDSRYFLTGCNFDCGRT